MSDTSTAPRMRARAVARLLLLALFVGALTAACSAGGLSGNQGGGGATPTRTPRPTFTPLPGALAPLPGVPVIRGTLPPGVTSGASPAIDAPGAPGEAVLALGGDTSLVLFATYTPTATATPTQGAPTRTPSARTATPAPRATPFVVIEADALYGRRGPGTNYERIGQAKAGDSLFVLGRTADNDWLQVCCMANQPVWVAADQVDARGAVASAPVLTPPPLPTATRPPVVAAPRVGQSPIATPRPAGPSLPPFDIARGPEFPIRRDNGLLTIWVKVYEGPADNQRPLGGFTLKVFRDGVDVSDNVLSFDDRPFDKTTPNQGAYEYNLKYEMYGAAEADWEIYLTRPGADRMSPVTKFTTKGDSYRNLVVYIAYLLAR